MTVEELMTSDIQSCGPDDSLNVAARIMWERDCGCVPVVEPEGDGLRVVGMLTDRDICIGAYTQGRPLSEITVRSAMAQSVRSCRFNDSVGTALKTLERNQLHRIPVLDQDDHVVGLLSLADIAREAEREHARSKKDVADEQVARTLEAISQPRRPGALATAA
jgi:predicted transcriptional regulator